MSLHAAARPGDAVPNGPLVQSIGIAFRLCVAATALLALAWLGSNIREVPPDATAVVTRFGRVAQVRAAGLLLAWPHPIDDVVLLPGPDQQLSLDIVPLPPAAGLDPAVVDSAALQSGVQAAPTAVPHVGAPLSVFATGAGADSYLTGDGGVVLLYADLTYRVIDPVAYMLAQSHVTPALNRVFHAAAAQVAATTPLDDFLVVDQSRAAGRAAANARLRDALLAAINRRLGDIGVLGVAVTQVNLTAALPPAAKIAFDSVLTATQRADQTRADARADATRRLQEADQTRDRILDGARAAAAERITTAGAHTATISALADDITPATRGDLLDRLYRARIGAIIAKAGAVTAIDPRGGPRIILPGDKP